MEFLDYSIKEIDITNSSQELKVIKLIKKVFGQPTNNLMANTYTPSIKGNKSFYLGAFIGEKLIGFNAFISHDFIYNGQIVQVFQSCWSASDPDHRGKKIWFNIINTAKQILKEKNAAFIIGFPNHNSHPIFTKKLGFSESPMKKVTIPSSNLLFKLFFKNGKSEHPAYENCFFQNDEQLVKHKRNEFGEEIIEVNFDNNYIWGRIRKKALWGVGFKYFDVGGMIINRPRTIQHLFDKLFKSYSFSWMQIVFHENNPYQELFKNVKAAPKTEPFIYYCLNQAIGKENSIHVMSGVKDVF